MEEEMKETGIDQQGLQESREIIESASLPFCPPVLRLDYR
jgi:hypothetical protein